MCFLTRFQYFVRYISRKCLPFHTMIKNTALAAIPTNAAEMKQFW